MPIPGLPLSLAGIRIAHVSDFHFRRGDRAAPVARELLTTLDADLVTVTGDFADWPSRWQQAIDRLRAFFEPIVARRPVFAVLGNHDDPRIADAPDLPLTFLRNETREVGIRGSRLTLGGLEQSRGGSERLSETLAGFPEHGVRILLAHYPSTVYRIPAGRADLVLSGHTHGGQIRLPLVGCVWTHDRIPRHMARGLHRVNGMHLHTTPGIGVSPPIRSRMRCPAEISLLSLQPADLRTPDAPACARASSETGSAT